MQNELFIFPLIHLVNITSWAGYLLFWDRAKAIRGKKKRTVYAKCCASNCKQKIWT